MKHSRARDPEAIEFARDERATAKLKLILEVDGEDHFTEAGKERDRVRDEALARKGYLVARISGFDVLTEPERVCQGIEERVRERMQELGVD